MMLQVIRWDIQKVVNNITKLHQNNINMLLKYIVLKENLHCYRGIKELAAEFKQDLKYGFELFPYTTW